MTEPNVHHRVVRREITDLKKKIMANEKRQQALQATLYAAKCDLLLAIEECQQLPLDERILGVVGLTKVFLSPCEIAHRVGFLRPNNQAYHVNAILYMLLDQGKIEKQTLGGHGKPQYRLSTAL